MGIHTQRIGSRRDHHLCPFLFPDAGTGIGVAAVGNNSANFCTVLIHSLFTEIDTGRPQAILREHASSMTIHVGSDDGQVGTLAFQVG